MCTETIRFGNITVLESAFLIARPCIQNGLEYWNGIPEKKENEDSEQRNWIENVTGILGNCKAVVRIALLVKLFLCLLWRNIFVEIGLCLSPVCKMCEVNWLGQCSHLKCDELTLSLFSRRYIPWSPPAIPHFQMLFVFTCHRNLFPCIWLASEEFCAHAVLVQRGCCK